MATGSTGGLFIPVRHCSPPGSWNNFEIHAIGHRYAVILNEKKVTEFTGSRLLEGYIGVQNHDADSRVAFRNIAIKELWDSC